MPKQRGPTTTPLFILVAAVTIVAALYFAKAILLPLGLAILLSFLLTPLANRLERWGLRRIPATLLVVFLLFAGVGALGYVVTTQLIELSHQWEQYRTNVLAKVHAVMPRPEKMSAFFKGLDEFGAELTGADSTKAEVSIDGRLPSDGSIAQNIPPDGKEEVEIKVVEQSSSPLVYVRDWLRSMLTPFGTAGMVLVLLFFILLDRENQRNRLLQLFGTSNLHATTQAMHDASYRVGRYLRMQFLVNACYGLAVGIGLALIGVPAAVLWGVLAFALRFLPYIGPWIAAALPIAVSLGHSAGWMQPLLVVGWFIGLELICNNAVEPWLYGSTTGVSVVGVILSALFWTWLWGPIGLILALPITVCLVVASRYVPQLRFFTVLLADAPPMTMSEQIYQRWLAFDYHEPVRLAHRYLKDSTLASFYEDVLVPALVLAEHDRHAELLNDEQETFVAEAAEDLVEELGAHAAAAQKSGDTSEEAAEIVAQNAAANRDTGQAARVLCVPLRDQADEVVTLMLTQLLAAEGIHVDSGTADSLTGEIVDLVAKREIDLVVISVLLPIAARDSRLLWKRLRSRYPDLPIIVGFWGGTELADKLAAPEQDTSSRVVTKLADAVAAVRSISAQQKLVAKTG